MAESRMRGHLNGFTLIELLVVVLIIGILAAVAVPQYQNAVKKARVMEGITMLQAIHRAQHQFQLARGSEQWTNNIDALDVNIPADSVMYPLDPDKMQPNKWYYYCFSLAGCVAAIKDADLPNFEIQINWDKQRGPNAMGCRFYDTVKTDKARQFCIKQLKGADCNNCSSTWLP